MDNVTDSKVVSINSNNKKSIDDRIKEKRAARMVRRAKAVADQASTTARLLASEAKYGIVPHSTKSGVLSTIAGTVAFCAAEFITGTAIVSIPVAVATYGTSVYTRKMNKRVADAQEEQNKRMLTKIESLI